MSNLLPRLVLLTLVGLLAIWVSDRPGMLTLTWQGYEIRTPLAVGFVAVLILLAVLLNLSKLYGWLTGWPARLKARQEVRARKRGEAALAQGLMALADGRAAEAEQAATESLVAMPDKPLPLILSAEVARLKGDREDAEKHYRALTDLSAEKGQNAGDRQFGLRGLFKLAMLENNRVAARTHARRALALQTSTGWALEGMFKLEVASGNWQAARQWLDRHVKQGGMEKRDANEHKAVLLIAEARQLAQGNESPDREAALKLAMRAMSLAPDLVPAVELAAQLTAGGKAGPIGKMSRKIEKSWAKNPHPDLLRAYLELRPGRSALQKLKAVQKLTTKNRDHRESRFALAQAALEARRWSTARIALTPEIESTTPSQRFCRLMAELEAAENEDLGRSREWFDRALNAPPDACWIGPTGQSMDWQPVCPQTGEFNACRWGIPQYEAVSKEALNPPPRGALSAPEPANIANDAAPAEKTA